MDIFGEVLVNFWRIREILLESPKSTISDSCRDSSVALRASSE
ncbi:hypothetical protein [Helicobacter marmotae]|nr:hypothetical protein [Helicobacter marmotae]